MFKRDQIAGSLRKLFRRPVAPDLSGTRVSIMIAGNLNTLGGVVRWCAEYVRHLSEQSCAVQLLGRGQRKAGVFYPLPADVRVDFLPRERSDNYEQVLHDRLADFGPDVVVVVASNTAARKMMAACRRLGAPIIRSERGDPNFLIPHEDVWRGDKTARLDTFRGAKIIHILNGEFAATQPFPDELRDKVRVIPSQIPEPDFIRIWHHDPARKRILYVGRLQEFEKSVSRLITAAGALRGRPDWELHMLGDGPDEAEYRRLVEELAIADRVIFHGGGSYEDVQRMFLECDICVLPSMSEGCPRALREAMAHGLPSVVMADCIGARTFVEHGRTGLVARPEQDGGGGPRTDLAGCLNQMLDDFDLRCKISRNAAASMTAYFPSKIYPKWDEMISEAVIR